MEVEQPRGRRPDKINYNSAVRVCQITGKTIREKQQTIDFFFCLVPPRPVMARFEQEIYRGEAGAFALHREIPALTIPQPLPGSSAACPFGLTFSTHAAMIESH
jgi:hypothetical protein